jgi:hypothetical protein
MADEFEVIEPALASITFGGAEITLGPLTVGQVPRAARALKAIGSARFDAVSCGDTDALLDLLAERGDELVDLVSAISGVAAERIRDVCPDEFLALAAEAIKVNADFFTQRLTPAIGKLMERINGAGQTPSSA